MFLLSFDLKVLHTAKHRPLCLYLSSSPFWSGGYEGNSSEWFEMCQQNITKVNLSTPSVPAWLGQPSSEAGEDLASPNWETGPRLHLGQLVGGMSDVVAHVFHRYLDLCWTFLWLQHLSGAMQQEREFKERIFKRNT